MSEDRYLEVGGARLRYRDDGQGHAVVLVHGWTLDLEMWEPQVAALASRYRVVRFDRRGFGLSSGIPGVAADADDIGELCRHLGITRGAFVGMSQGARVLVRLTAVAPQLISCLVFDGAADMRGDGELTSNDIPIAEYAAIVRRQGMEAFRRQWAAHPLARLITKDREMHELLERMLARYQGNDLRDAGMNAATAAGTHGATAAGADAAPTRAPTRAPAEARTTAPKPARQVPVLIINGELDLATRRRAGEALAHLFPNAEHASIADAGHLPNLDNSNAYNTILIQFIGHALTR